MKYNHIIEDMTWSYSRINCFESCPYQFMLKYIYGNRGEPRFFSEYGTLMHTLIEQLILGEMSNSDATFNYLLGMSKIASDSPAPTSQIMQSYLNNGLDYLKKARFETDEEFKTEKYFKFKIGKYDFRGIVDYIVGDVIIDHKSKAIKPRSKRKKPTLSDIELDKSLRQLYLYAEAYYQKYNKYPKELKFNCYRLGYEIVEPFNIEKLNETKAWAIKSVEEIVDCDSFEPDIDYWRCKHLCDVSDRCEYWQMSQGV